MGPRIYRTLGQRFVLRALSLKCVNAAPSQPMPSPKGLPFFGTTLSFIAAGSAPQLHKYVHKRHQQLGPIFQEKLGPVNAVFIADPEDMRSVFAQEGRYPIHVLPEAWTKYNELHGCSRGLFFMNGEEWLHFRRTMNKFLLKGDFSWIEQACEAASDNIIKELHKYPNQVVPDLENVLYKWSLDVIVAILLGHKLYSEHQIKLETQVKQLSEIVHLVFQTSAKLYLIPAGFASKYRIPQWKRFEKAVDEALSSANSLVDELLNLGVGDGLLHKMKTEGINRNEIVRIVSDLVLAAGDTTAYTMEWMLFMLGKNREVQEKLRNNKGCQYSRNVLKETLRLYPVAPFLTRVLPDASTIGGFSIPAFTLIIMSIYTSGRDQKYFDEPEAFIPERWNRRSSGTSANQTASLPFAMGVRSCIGKKIAETQLQLTLEKIIEHFDVKTCNRRDIDVVLKMVAVPSETVQLQFSPRLRM